MNGKEIETDNIGIVQESTEIEIGIIEIKKGSIGREKETDTEKKDNVITWIIPVEILKCTAFLPLDTAICLTVTR